MEENKTFIDSITIHFPSVFIIGKTSSLRKIFKAKYASRYYRYGNISLITINRKFFDGPLSLWSQIIRFIEILKNDEIIMKQICTFRIGIHKITLCFRLYFPELIFCKVGNFPGFAKKRKNVYTSNDEDDLPKKRSGIKKGKQRAFIKVENYDNYCIVYFSFSGKYRNHLRPASVFLDEEEKNVIIKLIKLGGKYLTYATTPDYFSVSRGFVPYLPQDFSYLLEIAGWFRKEFKKRNVTQNFLGGLLL